MKYFVSWTHSDPLFPAYLPDTRMLISPPNVNQIVQVRDLGVLPSALILDSGAFQYHRAGRMVAPADVLARQLHLAAGLPIPVGLCHLDVLVRGVRDTVEIERRVMGLYLPGSEFVAYI